MGLYSFVVYGKPGGLILKNDGKDEDCFRKIQLTSCSRKV